MRGGRRRRGRPDGGAAPAGPRGLAVGRRDDVAAGGDQRTGIRPRCAHPHHGPDPQAVELGGELRAGDEQGKPQASRGRGAGVDLGRARRDDDDAGAVEEGARRGDRLLVGRGGGVHGAGARHDGGNDGGHRGGEVFAAPGRPGRPGRPRRRARLHARRARRARGSDAHRADGERGDGPEGGATGECCGHGGLTDGGRRTGPP